ncbi:hypothetical protein PM082_005651 [Marasmius tenuissimus]|nr:hypothetical protein PM082_005651 [Marasmius tenuissimus]
MWTTAIYLVGNGHSQDEDIPKQLALLRELMLHIPSDREVILQEMIFRLIILERYQDALDELELYVDASGSYSMDTGLKRCFLGIYRPFLTRIIQYCTHTRDYCVSIFHNPPSTEAKVINSIRAIPNSNKLLTSHQGPHFNESTLREAKSHFERAVSLDSENVVAKSFLEKVDLPRPFLNNHSITYANSVQISALQDRKSGQNQDSDDDFEMNAEDSIDIGTPKRKRIRTTSTTREDI